MAIKCTSRIRFSECMKAIAKLVGLIFLAIEEMSINPF